MEKKILLVGGGGHCYSVLDCLLSSGQYDKIGIVDPILEKGSVLGVPIIGTDEDLTRLFLEGWTDAFITIGSVGNTKLRKKIYEHLKNIGFHIPMVVDRSAVIARNTIIEQGTFIGKQAVVNVGVQIGSCAIINTGAVIEHDCQLGDFVHISPGAILCGQVSVDMDSHIGAGSMIKQQVKIGQNVLVGIGSVVLKDILDNSTAFGNPCKVVMK